ncbi:autotransporter family protein [Cronobacter dublinensis]|uniref:autotransporter family protein n=1 Tax=Cronobacter dublinensis TaxID=413497 RepID=UPI000CFCBD08|nr:autotransporter outer membrane beta-barrel domain-containing protein [Cronobacter dublinensis]
MKEEKTFRINIFTTLVRSVFPFVVLSSPMMANAETIISKDTTSSYIVSGDTEYIVNPDVTMSSSKSKPAVSVQGEDIVTFTNNGTIKNDFGNAVQVEIDGQSSSMFTLQNNGTINSLNTGISVIDAKDVTIINTGTISGGDYAISFESGGNNALVLKAGSDLQGDVITKGSANNTITLNDSGSEDSNFIGADKGDGFKSLTMDGSEWTLTGDIDLTGQGDSLIVKTGKLTLGGKVTNTGASLIDADATLQVGTGSGDNAALQGNVTNNGTLVFNQAADYTFAGDISGSGNLVKENTSTLTLSGNNLYSGDTTLNGGTTLLAENGTIGPDGGTGNININDGATFASAGTVNSNVVIAAGGVLASWNAVSGNENATTPASGNTITGDVTNQGTLQIAGGNNVGNAFTIDGSYTGDAGSRIVMNTEAGLDDSPTDHLAITGDSAGSSALDVANIGGQGAQTINGIELISVGGASDASFTLDKPVVAGMWEYDLYQHDDGNWYLESKASDTPDPTPDQTPDPDDNGGNDNGGDTPAPEVYRPEAGVYMANYLAAQQMFIHKRDDRDQLMLRDADDLNTWMYVKGEYNDGNFADSNLKYKIRSAVVQLGSDVLSKNLSTGTLHSGFMLGAGYSDTTADARHNKRSADGRVNGYNVGVYATWQEDEKLRLGSYVDSWASYSWYNSQVNGDDMPGEKYDSQGYAASLELGHAWLVPSEKARTMKFEPQGQVIYSNLDQDYHVEYNGTRVGTPDNDAVQGRVGLKASYVDQKALEAWQPYGAVNWLIGNGMSDLSFNNETLDSNVPSNRLQLETGVSGKMNDATTVSFRVSSEWGDNSYNAYSGHMLVNYRW